MTEMHRTGLVAMVRGQSNGMNSDNTEIEIGENGAGGGPAGLPEESAG